MEKKPGTIGIFGFATEERPFVIFNPRFQRFMFALERRCLPCTCRLARTGIFQDGAIPRLDIDPFGRAPLKAAIVWIGNWYRSEKQIVELASRAAECADRGVPVILFTEYDYDRFPAELFAHSAIGACLLPTIEAGEAVGAFLKERGIDRAAYLSTSSIAPWSQKRCEGLCRALGSKMIEKVHPKTPFAMNKEMALAMCGFSDDEFAALHGIIGASFFKNITVEDFKELPPADSFQLTEEQRQRLRDPFFWLSQVWTDRTARPIKRIYANGVNNWMIRESIRLAMSPLFDSLIAKKEVPAWVCENDILALITLRYLKEKKADLPLIVGFDNTDQSLEDGFCSYSFDFAGIAETLLDVALHPDRHAEVFGSTGPVVTSGSVIDRS